VRVGYLFLYRPNHARRLLDDDHGARRQVIGEEINR
jgi:hypothetical protein